MRTISCKSCGKTFSEAQKEWDKAWQTGTCPACGRFYDSSVESQVDTVAGDPGVVQRARKKRFELIASGLPFLVAAILVAGFHGAGFLVAFLVIAGVPPIAYGLLRTPKRQARLELMRQTKLDTSERS